VGYFEFPTVAPAHQVVRCCDMPKRIRKPPEPDMNQLANNSIRRLTEAADTPRPQPVPAREPVSKAVSRVMAEMGRRGGKIGGARRAANMTEAQRSNAAALAANARWAKRRSQPQP
jgi:hypothetical protein